MKSSNQTNRFPIGSIVGEYHLLTKEYIDHYIICSFNGKQYKFCSIIDHDKYYSDSLEDNSNFEYHLVSDGTVNR